MSQPLPKTPLGSHCSILSGTNLYTVSENAFQLLSLTNGSQWQTLPPPISTKDAVCVHAGKGTTNEMLYVVGGATTNSSTIPDKGFFGLQQYPLTQGSNGKWKQLTVMNAVTFNLTAHGAAFIDQTNEIIVVGGTAYPLPAGKPSANTYLLQISGSGANTISDSGKTPLASPMVLPYGGAGALVVGGDSGNTNLNVYSPTTRWQTLSAKLSTGLPDGGSSGASLITGDDGSRKLLTFDFTKSPTAVGETLVAKAGGVAAKRDTSLTESSWPSYNSTGAPTGARKDTSVATDGDTIVITGGDDKNPVLMFNARDNSWTDVNKLLSDQTSFSLESVPTASSMPTMMSTSAAQSSTPTSTASSTSSATAGSALTTAPATSTGGGHKLNTVQLLFVILGSIIGFAILLACLLIVLRRKRIDQKRRLAGEKSTGGKGGKGRLSFQDRGASFMKEAGGTLAPPRAPGLSRPGNTDSWGQVQAYAEAQSHPSYTNSPTPMFFKNNSPTVHVVGGQGVISTPGSTPTLPPNDRHADAYGGTQERGSGWSKYFSGSTAQNLVGAPPRAYSGGRSSQYTDASYTQGNGSQNALHPNPNLYNAGPGVVAGGGTMGSRLSGPVADRRESNLSLSSAGGDSYSSGIPESVKSEKAMWSPVADETESISLHEGPRRGPVASSVYPESYRGSGPPEPNSADVDNLSWLNLRQN